MVKFSPCMGAKSEYYFERLGVYVVTYSLCARFRIAIQNNCGKKDSVIGEAGWVHVEGLKFNLSLSKLRALIKRVDITIPPI